MTVPSDLPEIGSTAQRLRQNPRFDPIQAGIGPEDYFVWSRFDGATTLKDLIVMTGLPTPRAVDIVRRLRTAGAILLPHEQPAAAAPRPSAAPPSRPVTPPRTVTPASVTPPRTVTPSTAITTPRGQIPHIPPVIPPVIPPASPPRGAPGAPASRRTPPGGVAVQRAPTLDEMPTARVAAKDLAASPPVGEARATVPPPLPPIPDASLSADERAALDEDVDVAAADRQRILAMHRRVQSGDVAQILGLPDLADKKAAKRAYFALSKEFHPDRYYGKRLGSYAARLSRIFQAVAAAYASLSGERTPRPSTGAGAGAAAGGAPAASAQPASPADHAADLFDRACHAEVSGDLEGALRLFAAALQIEATARYLRRAARCAMTAREPGLAVEYARKAAVLEPQDPSTARVLAAAFKAAGKLDQAEEVLVMAAMIPTENDQLMRELQQDLVELRRAPGR